MTFRTLLVASLALGLSACANDAEPESTVSTAGTATVAATAVPAGTYAIDAAHSTASFGIRHLGISTVKGSFGSIDGTLTLGETLSTLQATATMDASSISTGNADRDGHLQSPDFFDVAQYPEITFTSTEVRPGDGDSFTLVGDLTMHGVTQQVELDAEFLGAAMMSETQKVGFTATGTIDRRDWGLTWANTNDLGEAIVGDEVTLEIQIEADRQDDAPADA